MKLNLFEMQMTILWNKTFHDASIYTGIEEHLT